MAVAAGSALLRSVATKMRGMAVSPRASPLHHPLLLGGRRPGPTTSRQPFSSSSSAPSGSTPPPIKDKNLSQNKNVPGELRCAKQPAYVSLAPKVSYLTHFGVAAIIYFWVIPRLEELGNELTAFRRERSILIKAVEDCQRTHIQAKGHGKESDGQKTS